MSSQVADKVQELENAQERVSQLQGEIASLLGLSNGTVAMPNTNPAMVPVKTGKKRGRKPGSKNVAKPGVTRAKRVKSDGTKTPPAHVAVKSILKRHKNGLVLSEIRKELDAMRQKGEFQSNAKSLTSIVSVALDKLKNNDEVKRDNESTCWLAVG